MRCRTCGGTEFTADPASYYEDAIREDGAPMACMGKCRDERNVSERSKSAEWREQIRKGAKHE